MLAERFAGPTRYLASCQDQFYLEVFLYQSKRSFDLELSQDMLQARFDEMNVVLQSLNLIDPATITDQGIDDATAVSDSLKELQVNRGKEAARFAFIEWG